MTARQRMAMLLHKHNQMDDNTFSVEMFGSSSDIQTISGKTTYSSQIVMDD